MQNPAAPREAMVTTAISELRHSVQALIDGDLVLATDGRSLLATLGAALERLNVADLPAADCLVKPGAAMAEFMERVQALMETGLLEPEEAQRRIDAAASILASLHG
jgi:hypothetical protein